MNIDYPSLRALAALIRTGSFDAAAAEIGVTPSAVSQRIKSLEDQLGGVVVIRSQPAEATELGKRLVAHAEQIALLEHDLSHDIAAVTDRTEVRLAVNADSLDTWLLPALSQVPDMHFTLIVEDQDHTADLLRRGEVAAAITASGQTVQGVDATPLGALRYVATANPDFAARWFPEGTTAAALSKAPALIYSRKDRLQTDWATKAAGQPVRLKGHILPTTRGFVEAAEVGLGWGMNPEPLVRDALNGGRLVDLAPGISMETPLDWQVSRITKSALTPLTEAIRRAAKLSLVQPS